MTNEICGDTGPGSEFGYPPLEPCGLPAGHLTEDHGPATKPSGIEEPVHFVLMRSRLDPHVEVVGSCADFVAEYDEAIRQYEKRATEMSTAEEMQG